MPRLLLISRIGIAALSNHRVSHLMVALGMGAYHEWKIIQN